jgi:hypothetical protein
MKPPPAPMKSTNAPMVAGSAMLFLAGCASRAGSRSVVAVRLVRAPGREATSLFSWALVVAAAGLCAKRAMDSGDWWKVTAPAMTGSAPAGITETLPGTGAGRSADRPAGMMDCGRASS